MCIVKYYSNGLWFGFVTLFLVSTILFTFTCGSLSTMSLLNVLCMVFSTLPRKSVRKVQCAVPDVKYQGNQYAKLSMLFSTSSTKEISMQSSVCCSRRQVPRKSVRKVQYAVLDVKYQGNQYAKFSMLFSTSSTKEISTQSSVAW